MEMEMEAAADITRDAALARIEQAAAALEQAAERLAAVDLQATATRLAAAESTLATLRAGRKTGILTAKEGVAIEAGALDAALSTLSLEQRIAVKAQLLRSGLLR